MTLYYSRSTNVVGISPPPIKRTSPHKKQTIDPPLSTARLSTKTLSRARVFFYRFLVVIHTLTFLFHYLKFSVHRPIYRWEAFLGDVGDVAGRQVITWASLRVERLHLMRRHTQKAWERTNERANERANEPREFIHHFQ